MVLTCLQWVQMFTCWKVPVSCFSHRFAVGEYIWNISAGTVGHRWLSDNKSWGWDTVLDCCTGTDFNNLKYSALHHPSKQNVSLLSFFLFLFPKRCTINFILTLASLPEICSFPSLGHKKIQFLPFEKKKSIPTRNFHLYFQTEFL